MKTTVHRANKLYQCAAEWGCEILYRREYVLVHSSPPYRLCMAHRDAPPAPPMSDRDEAFREAFHHCPDCGEETYDSQYGHSEDCARYRRNPTPPVSSGDIPEEIAKRIAFERQCLALHNFHDSGYLALAAYADQMRRERDDAEGDAELARIAMRSMRTTEEEREKQLSAMRPVVEAALAHYRALLDAAESEGLGRLDNRFLDAMTPLLPTLQSSPTPITGEER